MSISPWTLHIPLEKISRLQQKIELADLPDEVSKEAWSQGPPLKHIQRLSEAWKSFDYNTFQRHINEQPNFQAAINVDGFDELDIHFIHHKNSSANAIPLLFVHGWPGSFLEAVKIKELLATTSPSEVQFNVVAPSLPNFGFSSGVTKPGFGLAQYAETCHKLMLSLGYTKYATQAGDWGYWITRAIGFKYPNSCIASHYNMIFAKAPSFTTHPLLALQHTFSSYTEAELAGQKRTQWFWETSKGYNVLQSSKPQTLGYALADSPIGLLAWLYEKLHDWSDDYPWSDHELLTFASVYWFSTAGPAAAQRIYYEVTHEKDPQFTYQGVVKYMPHVNIGLTWNPKEIEIFPKNFGRTLGNVVYEAENNRGGHFYAHEHPEWLVRDLQKMFGKEVNAFGL